MIFASCRCHVAIWTLFCFFFVFPDELTVQHSELELCKNDKKVCVTKPSDCGAPPPISRMEDLNMSCYYQMSHKSVTCEWMYQTNIYTETISSLILNSDEDILSCRGLLNSATSLNVTVRIRNYSSRSEIWSRPHVVVLYQIGRPSQPVLLSHHSTVDSLVVSWRSSSDGHCRLLCRNSSDLWSQEVTVLAREGQTLTYAIKNLLPFTVYSATVSCRGQSGSWSHWSPEVTQKTLERVPSAAVEVCYRVDKLTKRGLFHLHLMWRALDLHESGGRLLGYQVIYQAIKRQTLQVQSICNVSEPQVHLMVEEGNYSITVRAFNMAGFGPAASVNISTGTQHTLPPVQHLWVSRADTGLLVEWESRPSTLPVSHFVIQWSPEANASSSNWMRVDGVTTSALIQEHLEPDRSYIIHVYPVHDQHCGPPQSLPASLQHGALLEAEMLKVVGVSGTTVAAEWAWRRRRGRGRYKVVLRDGSHGQSGPNGLTADVMMTPHITVLQLWPDKMWHTFPNLTPHTEYSLILLADNVSMDVILVRTAADEVSGTVTAVSVLLLLITITIASACYMTVYKPLYVLPVSNPRSSSAGRWLIDANLGKSAESHILDIQDFKVTDVLGERSPIMTGPKSLPLQTEDGPMLFFGQLAVQLSGLDCDSEYIHAHADMPAASPQSVDLDYVIKCSDPGDVLLPHQTGEPEMNLHQECKKSEGDRAMDVSRRTGGTNQSDYPESVLMERFPFPQLICGAQKRINSPPQEKCDDETAGGLKDCNDLLCETDYISNCLHAVNGGNELDNTSF